MLQLRVERLLGAAVGGGDEIGRALERDLQLLDLAEIALERARGLARGGDHHVEQGGVEHGARRSARAGARRQGRGASWSTATSCGLFLRGVAHVGRLLGGEQRRGRDRWRRAALAMMCHLIASVGLAGMPRPAIRMRASRFCAIGAAAMRGLQQQLRGARFRSSACRCR